MVALPFVSRFDCTKKEGHSSTGCIILIQPTTVSGNRKWEALPLQPLKCLQLKTNILARYIKIKDEDTFESPFMVKALKRGAATSKV